MSVEPSSADADLKRALRTLVGCGALLVAGAAIWWGLIFWKASLSAFDTAQARRVEPFTLTERSGRPFSLDELRGKVWVADFFYTDCPGLCRSLSSQMAKLQQLIKDMPEVRLVSFSVDPVRDTPEVMRQYADGYGADPDRWFFLTGTKFEIQRLVEKNFLLAMTENPDPQAPPQDRVTHSSRFVLVDGEGRMLRYYEALEADTPTRIAHDIQSLQGR